jgi:hypothetical protein
MKKLLLLLLLTTVAACNTTSEVAKPVGGEVYIVAFCASNDADDGPVAGYENIKDKIKAGDRKGYTKAITKIENGCIDLRLTKMGIPNVPAIVVGWHEKFYTPTSCFQTVSVWANTNEMLWTWYHCDDPAPLP